MLKKLFIHEWKDTWKLVALLNSIVVLLTIIGAVVFRNDIWNRANSDSFLQATLMIYILFYICCIFTLGVGVGVYFWYRFYKNLYTDQGYLMHTLPVKPAELVFSKFFVAAGWNLISIIVMYISFAVLAICGLNAANGEEKVSFGSMFGNMIAEIWGEDVPVLQGGILIILLLLCLLSSIYMAIMMGYAAVSLGQLMKKNRLGYAVLYYVSFYILIQIVTSYCIIPFQTISKHIKSASQIGTFAIGILTAVFILMALLGALFYMLTIHIMKNNLNLE